MRKIAPLTNWEILITLVLLVSFFLWQFKANSLLNKELTQKRVKLQEIQAARQNLKDLEMQTKDLKERKEELFRRTPLNEEKPLSLMKTLIKMGNSMGFKEITLDLREDTEEAEAIKAALKGEARKGSVIKSAVKPIYLEMNFEAFFPQLPIFLEKLMKLERVVSVEGIKIERDKKALPYQKVSLDLVTYTFQE